MSYAAYDPSRPLNSQLSRPSSPPYTPHAELSRELMDDASHPLPSENKTLAGLGVELPSSADPYLRSTTASPSGKKGFKESFIASSSSSDGPTVRSGSSGIPNDTSYAGGPSSRTGFALTPETGTTTYFGGPSYDRSPSAAGSRHGPSGSSTGESYHPLSSSSTSKARSSHVGETTKSVWDSEAYWLGLYFFFNLGLTLFNKIVLVSFPFPYTLTGLHALSGCAGSYIALERGNFTPAHLAPSDNIKLAAFSVLYTINIAVSNLSLQLVTVPFHQVVRAATPLFTIGIAVVFLGQGFSFRKLAALLPVIAGVGFATYGEYNFTMMGLLLTLLGTFLAALKTVMTNVIQTGGIKLHPLDLLMRMSPLAFIQCVVFGWSSGELERVRTYGALEMTRTKAFALVVNGAIAFGLNVVSFTANKKTSPLTMTVAANVKQVLTIVLAVIIFDLTITPTNGVGIMLTLMGGALYAFIEFTEKQKKQQAEQRRLTEK